MRGTAQQMEIIANLQAGLTRSEVAAVVGCDVQTVSRVKKKLKDNPDLMDTLFKRCATEIDRLVPLAIMRLESILMDDSRQDTAHVGAAREVFNRSKIDEVRGVNDKAIEITVKHV